MKTAVRRDRLPLLLALTWVVGAQTIFVLGNDALAATPALNVTRLGWAILAALFLVRFLRGQPREPWGRVEKAAAVYAGILTLSWITTVPHKDAATLRQDGALLLDGVLMPLSALLFARNFTWTRTRVLACLWVLAAGVGLYLVVTGLGEYAFTWDLFKPRTQAIVHPDRVTGPFTNALEYGMVASFALLLTVFVHAQTSSRSTQLVLWLVAGGLVQGIVFSKGRGVWLALPLALGFVALKYPRARRLAVVVGLALVSEVLLLRTSRVGGVSERLSELNPLYNRIAAYVTATNMIVHKPIFGFGFGTSTFRTNKASYQNGWGPFSDEWVSRWVRYPGVPHNEFLHILVLTGVIGLGAYLSLLWAIWRQLSVCTATRAGGDRLGPGLAVLVQASWIVVLINALFMDVMYLSSTLILFYFLLGIALQEAEQHV